VAEFSATIDLCLDYIGKGEKKGQGKQEKGRTEADLREGVMAQSFSRSVEKF